LLVAARPATAAEPDPLEVAVDDPSAEATGSAMLRYPPSSVRGGLIGGGLGLTAVPYAAGMVCGFVWADVPGADALKIPVVGPWIALGQSGCAPDQTDCAGMLVLRTILTTLSGLTQLGGLGLAAEGFFGTTEAAAEPGAEASTEDEAGDAPASLHALDVAPMVGPTVAGVGISGRF
jgi:hypothetical protein